MKHYSQLMTFENTTKGIIDTQVGYLAQVFTMQQMLLAQTQSQIMETHLLNIQDYAKKVEKLNTRCRNNGDEQCDCRKCQCIKRNRDSAREAQKRKREALEKYGSLREECDKLEKKVKSLSEKNSELKLLLKDVLSHPIVQQSAITSLKELPIIGVDSCEGTPLHEC